MNPDVPNEEDHSMLPLSARRQLLVGLILVATMAATRVQHAGILGHLPDASWALFFLAGVYLRPTWAFGLLLGEAVMLDFAAVTWGGVSSFCITPAYALLVPAHGVLWFAGRWYARHHHAAWSSLLPLGASVLAATALAEIIASGGFYIFSGRFADPSLAGLGSRLIEYFPSSLEATALYVGLAALVHVLFTAASHGPLTRRLSPV
jgi:hypothetical protein